MTCLVKLIKTPYMKYEDKSTTTFMYELYCDDSGDHFIQKHYQCAVNKKAKALIESYQPILCPRRYFRNKESSPKKLGDFIRLCAIFDYLKKKKIKVYHLEGIDEGNMKYVETKELMFSEIRDMVHAFESDIYIERNFPRFKLIWLYDVIKDHETSEYNIVYKVT